MTEIHPEALSESEVDFEDMHAHLRKIRLMGEDLVVDPIQPNECVMKEGSMINLLVYDDKNEYNSYCSCVVANENESTPFEVGKRIKEAICGEVYTGFQLRLDENGNYKRGDMVVIKIMSLNRIEQLKMKGKCLEDPIKEVSILQMLGETSQNVCTQIVCIRDDKYIYSIMKHYGEELFNYAGKLSENECRNYFRQIINGVDNLQAQNICHRDLSLENILVSPDGVCTIIDFGMSLIYPTAKESTLKTVFNKLSNIQGACSEDIACDEMQVVLMPPQGTCGKKNYIAPEILTNVEPFNGAKVDNWALGVILFMLLTGRPPFHRASMLDKWYRMIQQNKLREMLAIWKVSELSNSSVDLLQILLKGGDHKNRMKIDDILLHPWFKTVPSDADEDSLQC